MKVYVEKKEVGRQNEYEGLPDKPGVYKPLNYLHRDALVIRLQRSNELLYVIPDMNVVEPIVSESNLDYYRNSRYTDADQEVVLRFKP